MTELTEVFSRMMKTPCAISKLEYLLEAVRLTYESVRDSKAPKKPMNDLGADGMFTTMQYTTGIWWNIRHHIINWVGFREETKLF